MLKADTLNLPVLPKNEKSAPSVMLTTNLLAEAFDAHAMEATQTITASLPNVR